MASVTNSQASFDGAWNRRAGKGFSVGIIAFSDGPVSGTTTALQEDHFAVILKPALEGVAFESKFQSMPKSMSEVENEDEPKAILP